MSDEDGFECTKCGRTFDSQRGLSIHQTQAHSEDEQEKEDQEPSKNVEKEDNSSVSFNIKTVMAAVFTLGIAIGFSAGIIADNSLDLLDNSNGAPSNPDTETGEQDDSTIDVSNIETSTEPVLGDTNAPVTMIYWSDFECPFCQRFEMNSMPQIMENYVETGQVKVVFKDYPLPGDSPPHHKWAEPAATAMECVYREGGNEAFWNVKSTIFENQNQLSTSNVQSQIKSWASDEGVSQSSVQSCIDSDVSSEVQKDRMEGQDAGISGTPGFVIYRSGDSKGTQIVGAQPFSRFQTVIDSNLEK